MSLDMGIGIFIGFVGMVILVLTLSLGYNLGKNDK